MSYQLPLQESFPVFDHLLDKEMLPSVQLNLPWCSFEPLLPILSLDPRDSPHLRNVQKAMRLLLNLLSTKLAKPQVLSFFSQDIPFSPFIDIFSLLWTHSRTFKSFLYFPNMWFIVSLLHFTLFYNLAVACHPQLQSFIFL